ncbi:MAG: DNA replication/repair protein RecF [Peptococcaceae bacterium]|nr:DNA replication/repair protein RecF [Peptococcaceae bacterium]
MYLKLLELNNFRNYKSLVLEPGLFLNIITGQNAQGKTSILEAIYMSCKGNSFRTNKEREIINWESDLAHISSLLQLAHSTSQVKITIKQGLKRIKINGSTKRGSPLGWPGVVLFTADDLALVKGSPYERRRFMDLELGPFHLLYNPNFSRFQRTLAQRNNLLREIRKRREGKAALKIWNEQLSRYGAKILFIRLELLKRFSPLLRVLYRELSGETEIFDLRYKSTLKLDGLSTEEEIYDAYQKQLAMIEAEEIERAQSLLGPHRDDLVFFINGRDAKVFGSQGQQRTIVLTLKIAQIDLWREEIDESPILLLDDVIFELDDQRRQAIFKRVGAMTQTFLTTTKIDHIGFPKDLEHRTYTVHQGQVLVKG